MPKTKDAAPIDECKRLIELGDQAKVPGWLDTDDLFRRKIIDHLIAHHAKEINGATPRRGVAVSKLDLPQRFKATEAELPVLSRLVRVMRQKDNRGAPWLGLFIEWLLYRENWNGNLTYQSSGEVFADLKAMGGDDGGLFASAAAFLKAARKQCPGITFASATSAFKPNPKTPRETWANEMLPAGEEDQFYQILRLWRKDHPEPQKRREFPKGRTQHDSDPDSD